MAIATLFATVCFLGTPHGDICHEVRLPYKYLDLNNAVSLCYSRASEDISEWLVNFRAVFKYDANSISVPLHRCAPLNPDTDPEDFD